MGRGARVVIDDARHPLLRKARPVQQAGIEAFDGDAAAERRAPVRAFGATTVQEVDVQSALTFCAMPGEPWSLNPYVGCAHACVYCYVPDVAHMERDRWGSYVIAKRNLPNVLARELKRKEKRDVFLSSATDPYQAAEATHRVTRRCLDVLVRADWPLRVLTRSPLVRRDVDVITRFSDASVGFSVPTLDDAARRAVEPAAPPIAGRLQALRDLADAGVHTYANLAPAYPLTGGVRAADVAQAFKDAGVSVLYAWPWRYLEHVVPALKERVDATIYRDFVRAITDDRYWDRYFSALRGACRRVGVRLEGAPVRGRNLKDGPWHEALQRVPAAPA